MKVCDVVLNSVWYDPRVRKQIASYVDAGINLSCVGHKCERYDEEKIKQIPCKTEIYKLPPSYEGHQKSLWRKIYREHLSFAGVRDKILAEKPDVIHANDLNSLLPAYAACKKLKCRLIYDSHEVYVDNIYFRKRRFFSWVLKKIEAHIVKKVDLMICVSHAAADYFSSIYKIKNLKVITNCAMAKDRTEIPAEKRPGFEVLNHGQFYEGRGYDLMVRSIPLFKKYPEVKLAIRGFGTMEEELKKCAEELNAGDQFRFYPPVNVDQLIPCAAASHVGVAVTEPICLNFKLSISNKIFEYAAAGLPVIMSDIPEHRYLNEKYKIGIVISENTPECFFHAVMKFYEDKEFYQECSRNALAMSKSLNWENEFAPLIRLERSWISEQI